MTFDGAKRATAALRRARQFKIEVGGACAFCTTDRVTVRASAANTVPGAEC